MKTTTVKHSADFINHIVTPGAATGAGRDPAWLQDVRAAGAERARHLGIPNRSHEEWLYADLRPLTDLRFADSGGDSLGDFSAFQIADAVAEFIFVDGALQSDLSRLADLPDGLTLMPLAEAVTAEPEALRRVLTRVPPDKENVFAALNKAVWRDGVFIRAAADADIAQPIHLLHLTTAGVKPIHTQPRTVVLAGEKSAVRVIETFASIGSGEYFTNAVADVILEEDAAVEYYIINRESDAAFHVSDLRLTQAGGSHFHSARADVGGRFVRNNIDVAINGEAVETDLNGVYALANEQVVDNAIFVHHRTPGSVSRQLYKGVLDDKSRGVFAGKILVDPEAQQTNAYQTCRHLLLSDGAEANTRPMLEIFADDVKCSHGATTGPVVPEELFYLESRGIPRDPAMRLLARGFIYDVIYSLKNEIARDHIDQALRFVV